MPPRKKVSTTEIIAPPTHSNHLSSVRKARLALKARASEILDAYLAAIKLAQAEGDFETATKSYQWLMEHMPDEDGEKLVDVSIDKVKQLDDRPTAPSIHIGFALSGVPASQPQLPEPSIEIIPIHDSNK